MNYVSSSYQYMAGSVSSVCRYLGLKNQAAQEVKVMAFPLNSGWTRIAGLSGALAVILGAYGAHGLHKSAEVKKAFDSANYYHFIHTLALLGVPLTRRPMLTGSMILFGTALFSGTVYYYVFTGTEWVKKITPIGGTTLIFAWLSMII